MSSNIDPDALGGEPTPAPEPAAPEIDPRAAQIWEGLNNIDRRPDTLNQVLRPGVDLPDGMDWQTARSLLFQQQNAQPEAPPDPFDEVYGPQPQQIGWDSQGNPVYDQPYQQPQQFDPRELAPVFDQFGQQITQNAVNQAVQQIEQRMMQQAQEQALASSVQQAAQQHNLTDFGRGVVEQMTRHAQQQGDRRSPSEIAGAMAQQYLADANQRFVAQGGVAPVQGAAAPSGMIPAGGLPPNATEAEILAYSRSELQRPM